MTSTSTYRPRSAAESRLTRRAESLSGPAFVLLFIASVTVSNAPADGASGRRWIADYAGHANQARHFATGLLLVLAGLCLLTFLTGLWRRLLTRTKNTGSLSPLPLAAAAVSASCMAAGGIVMGFVSGGELLGSYPLPGADVLRLSNDLGFGLAGVAGMIAAGLSVGCLSVQGRRLGALGRGASAFGIAVSTILLGSFFFLPIVALLVWVIFMTIRPPRMVADPETD